MTGQTFKDWQAEGRDVDDLFLALGFDPDGTENQAAGRVYRHDAYIQRMAGGGLAYAISRGHYRGPVDVPVWHLMLERDEYIDSDLDRLERFLFAFTLHYADETLAECDIDSACAARFWAHGFSDEQIDGDLGGMWGSEWTDDGWRTLSVATKRRTLRDLDELIESFYPNGPDGPRGPKHRLANFSIDAAPDGGLQIVADVMDGETRLARGFVVADVRDEAFDMGVSDDMISDAISRLIASANNAAG